MSESKHTPEPWVVETSTKGFEVCTLHGVERQPTEDGLGQSWVYVRPASMVRDGEWHWPNEAEQLANARLIAAAPELLEALRELTKEAARNIYPKPDVGPDHPYSILRRAEAAIAKAEGRS